MNQFTEEYLKSYETQIRKLPLDELYEVMDIIKKDTSPERINIVKARIRELESTEGNAQNNSFHFKKNYTLHTKQTWSEWSKEFWADLDPEHDNTPQPLPDKEGLFHFVFWNALVLAATFAVLFFGAGMGNPRNAGGFHDLRFFGVLKIIQFAPIAAIIFSSYAASTADKLNCYWLRHHKLALSISTFLVLHSIVSLIIGEYTGLFYSSSDAAIYPLAGTIFIFSTLYTINAFYPLSRKFRPKHGLTLLALVIALELTARYYFV